jgi:hypothetical protein
MTPEQEIDFINILGEIRDALNLIASVVGQPEHRANYWRVEQK